MPFGDHLEELRRCLIRSLVGAGVGTVVSLAFARRIIHFLCQPLFSVQELHGLPSQLQALSPQAGFVVYLKVGFLAGLIVAMPWLLIQLWSFIASGLYPREHQVAKRFIPVSIALFGVGAAFLYAVVLPIVLSFFVSFNLSFSEFHTGPSLLQRFILGGEDETTKQDDGTEQDEGAGEPTEAETDRDSAVLSLPTIPRLAEDPKAPADGSMWVNTTTGRLMIEMKDKVWSIRLDRTIRQSTINSQFAIDFYVSFVLMLMLAFGLAFELPIAVWFVSRIGLMSTQEMGHSRKYVILGLVVIAAVLTPPDVISQIMLAVPMYGLFEIGLLVARVGEKRREGVTERAEG